MNDIARSASAVIVRLGLTPRLAPTRNILASLGSPPFRTMPPSGSERGTEGGRQRESHLHTAPQWFHRRRIHISGIT